MSTQAICNMKGRAGKEWRDWRGRGKKGRTRMRMKINTEN